jgi:hypothetical protein
MADTKISALTAATTPLAGTEVLPIVQSGTTVKVSVDNLTTGKNVKAASLSVNTTGTAGKVTVNGDVQAQGGFGVVSGSLGVAIGAASGAVSGNDMCVIAGDAYNNYKDLLIAPRNNGSDVGNTRFTSGDVVAVTGNLVIGTSGKGIDFSATPGTGTSELLSDYEEGTWTPTIAAAAGIIISTTNANCKYTKVGRVVVLTGNFGITLNGTGAGAITISNLPFAANTANAGGGIARENSVDGKTSSITQLGSATSFSMYRYDNTYPGADGANFNFEITYIA